MTLKSANPHPASFLILSNTLNPHSLSLPPWLDTALPQPGRYELQQIQRTSSVRGVWRAVLLLSFSCVWLHRWKAARVLDKMNPLPPLRLKTGAPNLKDCPSGGVSAGKKSVTV